MSVTPSVAVDNIEQSSMPISNGKTLYVGGSGEGNYTRIQDAIDDANSGDTVFVFDDSSPYYENISVNKSINLIGEDRDTTIIDGCEIGDVVFISADRVTVRGFTIRNSSTMDIYDSGIRLEYSSHCTISDNILTDNSAGIYTYAWYDKPNKYNIISNNIFRDNHHFWGGIGIALFFSRFTIIKENTFVNNSDGIYIMNGHFNIISKNNITFCTEVGIGISLQSMFNVVKKNNFIENECSVSFLWILFCPTLTRWYRNYWDDWSGKGPKIIKGGNLISLYVGFPIINCDWFPARQPYDIGV